MKSLYLLCTKPLVYLTELPVLILLTIALRYNSESDELFKFYPLIVFLSFAVIFILVYFLKVISVNFEEIRYHGLFSSRDSAFIGEGKSLVLLLKPKRNIGIELYGDAGKEPIFDWMKAEDVIHRDICLFRGKANGGIKTVKKIIGFFISEGECPETFVNDGFEYEDDNIRVSTSIKNECKMVTIKFKKTIL